MNPDPTLNSTGCVCVLEQLLEHSVPEHTCNTCRHIMIIYLRYLVFMIVGSQVIEIRLKAEPCGQPNAHMNRNEHSRNEVAQETLMRR